MEGRQNERPRPAQLAFQYVLFTFLGLFCSYLWRSYFGTSSTQLHLLSTQTREHSLDKNMREMLRGTDCDDVIEKAAIPEHLKNYMGTKLRYQFESHVVANESSLGECRAVKVKTVHWRTDIMLSPSFPPFPLSCMGSFVTALVIPLSST